MGKCTLTTEQPYTCTRSCAPHAVIAACMQLAQLYYVATSVLTSYALPATVNQC